MHTYENMVRILLFTFFVFVALLIYRHLEAHSLYLSTHWWGVEITRRYKNTLSAMLAIIFPFYFSRFIYKKNMYNLITVGVISYAIFYTLSRMAYLCFFSSFFFFFLFSLKRLKYIRFTALVTIIMVAVLFLFSINIYEKYLWQRDPAFRNAGYKAFRKKVKSGEVSFINFKLRESHRGLLLLRGLNGLKQSPIWGHGIKTFRGEGRKFSLSHNDYIQLLYELGLLGLFLFVGIGFLSLRDLLRLRKRIEPQFEWLLDGQIVSLMISFFILLFINAYQSVIIWFVLAGSQIFVKLAKRQSSDYRSRLPNSIRIEDVES